MQLVKPNQRNGRNGHRPPAIPAWLREWRANQGKWMVLKCGCILDINLPSSIMILTRNPDVLCDSHGFQKLDRPATMKDRLKEIGIELPETDQYPRIPLF